MSGSSSTNQTVSRSGFSAADVAEFVSKGNKAGSNLKSGGIKKKTGTTSLTRERGTFLGVEVGGAKETLTKSGFFGGFTNKSDGEIGRLINVFEKRRNLIANRKRAPGASQTRLVG